MPYYGVPVKVTYQGVTFEETGFAFSRAIVTDLLRTRLGFTGYVNSDTGIINDRAWGLEQRTVPERVAAAINGGTDVLSGFSTNATITDLVRDGPGVDRRASTKPPRACSPNSSGSGCSRIPTSTPAKAPDVIGSAAHRARGLEVQKQSIVLLREPRDGRARPRAAAAGRRQGLHDRHGQGRRRALRLRRHRRQRGARAGAARPPPGTTRRSSASRCATPTPAAIARRIRRRAPTRHGSTRAPASRGAPRIRACCSRTSIRPAPTTAAWAAARPVGLLFGGALPWEADHLSFTTMAGVRVVADHAVARRHPGGDARGRAAAHRAGHLLPQPLRARRRQRPEGGRARSSPASASATRPCSRSSAAGSSRSASCRSRWPRTLQAVDRQRARRARLSGRRHARSRSASA